MGKTNLLKPLALSVMLAFTSNNAAFAAKNDHKATQEAVQQQVQSAGDKAIASKEAEAIKEALDAVLATRAALTALDQGRTKEALAHLEIANGKLSLLISRYPELGLIPISSEAIVIDYEGDLKSIKKAIDRVEDWLDDGEVQQARALLSTLASEIRITTTNMPLALYPDAIKEVAPLIDQGKIKEAKEALMEALNTLVITESVIPLPVLRAEAMIRKVYEEAHSKNPSPDEMLRYLDSAKYQLRVAQALGYGDIDTDYKPLYKAIDKLEDQAKSKKWGEALNRAIEKLQKALNAFKTDIAAPQKIKSSK